MARDDELKKWRAGLRARFPLVGRLRREWAMNALEAHRNDPDVVPLLVEALDHADEDISARAAGALVDLTIQAAVDALCALWAKQRDERLGQIIEQRGYVASAPVQVRVLSGLKAGAREVLCQADAEAMPHLVAAMDEMDPAIQQNALAVLGDIQNPKGVDALCALWAEQRDERLGQIIAQRTYIANKPLRLKALTALKCGKRLALDRADVVPLVVGFLADADKAVCSGAARSLEQVGPGPAQDALCDEAIKDPKGEAAKLCLRTGKRPSDHERLCLFLFVTALLDRQQLDAYFREDFEFQNLRLQYDRADATVRNHVMEVVRMGDRRCAGFFGTRSKPLAECTEAEIALAIASWQRHQEWGRLFHACLELPLRLSLPVWGTLRRSKWEPESPDLRSVYRQILDDAGDLSPPPASKSSATSSLFEQWLVRGRSGELASLEETALRKRLEKATPPEGVAIVAALAAKKPSSSAAAQAVRQSPHWLVRLAGYATGLIGPDLTHDHVQDVNCWIRELVSAAGVWEFWPAKSTPADLDALSAAPPEAWAGRLGAARKVLRTIMAYRITAGTFEPMVVEADEFAGEFVQAADVEFETRGNT